VKHPRICHDLSTFCKLQLLAADSTVGPLTNDDDDTDALPLTAAIMDAGHFVVSLSGQFVLHVADRRGESAQLASTH